MKMDVKTDFEFKGNRNYVHSSTLMETLCSLVHDHFHAEGNWEEPKTDAQFHEEVASNGVITLSEDRGQLQTEPSPSAFLRFFDGNRNIFAALVQDQDTDVLRRIEPEYAIEGLALEGEFSGKCHIDISSRTALIENIIEANKRIHLQTLEHKGPQLKVVNLYVKKFPLGLPDHKGGSQALLKIENRGVRQRGDSVATLNTLHFPDLPGGAFEMCFVVYGL
jgi:hypothetical protein